MNSLKKVPPYRGDLFLLFMVEVLDLFTHLRDVFEDKDPSLE